MKIVLNKIYVDGDGCDKDMPISVKLTSSWNDPRFSTEADWLKYSKIDNLDEN